MRTRYWYLSLLLALSLLTNSAALAEVKKIGTPRVKNYDNSLIHAGTQTWMIDAAPSGLMYYANNEGVLEFDGLKWRKYPLPQKSVVRSIKAMSDGSVFAGGHNEMGYFKASDDGSLVYHSLHHLVPKERKDYGEVWRIFEMPYGIIFQTFTQVMIYRDSAITVVDAPDMFHFSFVVNKELYVNDQKYGLYKLADNKLNKLKGVEVLQQQLIWAMLPLGNQILISTADNGMYLYNGDKLTPWKNTASAELMRNQVFSALPLEANIFAFGTIQDGILICDSDGHIFQQINIDKGLQNNTVLSMQTDMYSNLWLGLDNGIDYVENNSPLSYLSANNNLSAGYNAVVHDGKLYLGTNRGVFYQDWNMVEKGSAQQKFTLVPGTQGQVWALRVIEGTLFCGHNSGIFIIEDNRAKPLSDVQGGWTFIQPKGRNDIVICGTYTYLVRFERKNGKWSQGKPVEGFKESSRFMVNGEPGSAWISHGYKGVFRVHFNQNFDSVASVDFYDNRHGFPSNKDISVFEIADRPVFTTGRGVYSYNNQTDSFLLDDHFSKRFSRTDMNYLKEDKQGNIWYFTSERAGVYRLKEDGHYTEVEIPFRVLDGKHIKWFQFVYPFDGKNVFMGTQNGFVHYNPRFQKNYQQPFRSFIRSVQILAGVDSLLYKGTPGSEPVFVEIPHKFNQLQFEFAANDFENADKVKFFSKLQGFENEWIDIHSNTFRQFTNLRHGNYVFMLKAINIYGVESDIATFPFTIQTPWYFTKYAFGLYLATVLLMMYLALKYIYYRVNKSKKAFAEEQKRIFAEKEKQMQIDALINEQEVIQLRNEKLQSEKIQKDKELANTTMQIIQNSKTLVGIKNDLRRISKELGSNQASGQIESIIRKINKTIDTDNQWKVFETHFENVHEEFLQRLKENHPTLTPNDRKLCAYLRLNISSKEIANLMNISVRGVEICRYRLRKKLDLEHDKNLTDFIITF
jgi:ligand-binding sensor domain-containing protein/DNA-binding CsgD family transcriptional regulator